MGEAAEDGKLTVPAEVLTQRLPDDELVILNLETEQYYGLDKTGTIMWTALTEAGDVERAYTRLQERFDVDPEVLRRDLDAFVDQLRSRGLVRVGTDAA